MGLAPAGPFFACPGPSAARLLPTSAARWHNPPMLLQPLLDPDRLSDQAREEARYGAHTDRRR